MDTESIPWVEKYRPKHLSDVVLDDNNKIILDNIIENDHFPNLLLYGPPGTGKTTTIINLINSYQIKYNQNHKGLMIHLNASDERGIDIIRNQIASFVNSSGLFMDGMKFVVLDEVDYMTKNAQQALKYLLQSYNTNVRYCLICNYISRIDESLQNEFIRLRFNQLPEDSIKSFLKNIVDKEKLDISDESIKSIQSVYQSDIRSMINYIQSNQNILSDYKIINYEIWDNLTHIIGTKNLHEVQDRINQISNIYGIEKKSLLKEYFNYMIYETGIFINKTLLDSLENLIHNTDLSTEYYVNYAVLMIGSILRGNTLL
tara:strand:+ start:2897 stop:3844 length:948 start_codon:yes stop_codon:yes gene_type:complete